VETNIANGPEMTNGGQGGLENEDVFVVNFKWGSMVALGLQHGTSIYFDHWDPSDVVWVNSGFSRSIDGRTDYGLANGYFGNYLGYGGDTDISAAQLDPDSRANGYGDICEELTNGVWRYPSGPTFQTTESYAGVYAPTGTNYPFGHVTTTQVTPMSWSALRSSNYNAVTYWRDASRNTATGLASDQIAPHIPIGLFGDEGQVVSEDKKFFLPAAGARSISSTIPGTSSSPGKIGMYWTAKGLLNGTADPRGYPILFSYNDFGSDRGVVHTDQMSAHHSFPVRCVTVGPE
jgi:hypothetical protein